jgi:C4-dicarboxylate-specific signal transduction histidine kinase
MKNNFVVRRYYLFAITVILVVGVLLIARGFRRISGEVESHHSVLLTFRTFQQLNHKLNENMLRSRSFLLQNYDPLVANAQQIKTLCAAVSAPSSTLMASQNNPIIEATIDYCKIINRSVDLVELFKSKNSILRNSIEYLSPLAGQFSATPLEIASLDIMNRTLTYSVSPTSELASEIELRAKTIQKNALKDARYKAQVNNLLFHTRLIVRSLQERHSIESEILSVKTQIALGKLESNYQKWYRSKEKVLERYYLGLLIVSLCLGVGIYLTVNKLQRTLSDLHELNETLETKVITRTAQLSSALGELEAKQQMLLQSTKMSALGEMAGGIAHEINTPLGAILLNAEMLTSTAIENGQYDMIQPLESIIKVVERISKIITGLRRFARNDSQDEKKPCSVRTIIDDTLTLCQEKIRARYIELQVSYEDENIKVACLPEQISQVILNLLSNSVDAVTGLAEDQHWIKIKVSFDSGALRIAVIDSGSGIPIDVREKIMNPFFTTKEVGKGTGLGLSISKGIIESHGGTLFYDLKSKHTTFVIELPAFAQRSLVA